MKTTNLKLVTEPRSKARHPVDAPRGSIYKMSPEELVIIGLDEIDGESKLNDERLNLPLDEKLVRDIMKYGVRENIVGRKNRATGKVEVVDGRQRTRCAREANKRLAQLGESEPVHVLVCLANGDDELMFELQEALNYRVESTPLMRARTAQKYLLRVNDRHKVCELFGVSNATLEAWLTLLQMSPDIHDAVDAKKISSNQALQLSKLSRSKQKVALEQLLALDPKERRPIKRPKNTTDKARMPSKTTLINIITQEEDSLDPNFLLGLRFALGLTKTKVTKKTK